VATTTASDELLRVQPEIAVQISKLVNAVKNHSDVHQQKLEEVLSVVNAVANGQFQIALPGPLTAQLVPGLAIRQPSLVPGPVVPPHPPPPPPGASADANTSRRAPEYTLFDARTVADVWREWKEGIAGRPALQELEETWGHLLRPKPKDKTAWSRRKVILDELTRLIARGRSEEAAVAELEALRAGRHLQRLIEDLKARQKARIRG
jgi:hypothetical protein